MHIMGTFDRWHSFDSVRRWRVKERAATCHAHTTRSKMLSRIRHTALTAIR